MLFDELTLQRLKNNDPTLTSLDLMDGEINATGIQLLAEALKNNQTLTSLVLYKNQIGTAGVQALADALKNNQTLISLVLYENELGAAESQALADALKGNRMLTSLDLGGNEIGVAGAQALAEALTYNQTLTSLVLNDHQLGTNNEIIIKELIVRNRALAQQFLQVVRRGDKQAIRQLLQQGVSINCQDQEDKNTALHMAVKQGDYSLVQFLINQSAIIQLKNRQGKTAWQMAQDTPMSGLVHEIKPYQIPSLKGFCLFKVKQLRAKPDLLPQGQQQPFTEVVANLPEELKSRLG